jgi:hypothetical protein
LPVRAKETDGDHEPVDYGVRRQTKCDAALASVCAITQRYAEACTSCKPAIQQLEKLRDGGTAGAEVLSGNATPPACELCVLLSKGGVFLQPFKIPVVRPEIEMMRDPPG